MSRYRVTMNYGQIVATMSLEARNAAEAGDRAIVTWERRFGVEVESAHAERLQVSS